MGKVVLVIPPSPWMISDRDQPLTGVLYISSYLKSSGHDVQVCDLSGIPEDYWYIPVGDIYGITGVTPQFFYMKRIISILRERQPNCKIVVGGVHATVLPQHILAETEADACVVGEGEDTMLRIANGGNLKYLRGVITRNGTLRPRAPLSNLDWLPFPDRCSVDYFSYMRPHTYKYLANKREGSIITSRGCPYSCAYCASPSICQKKVRYRSPQNVYEELRDLKEYFDMGSCNFIDDMFTLNKKRVYKICKLIAPLNIVWYFLTRVDCVDAELFAEMKKAGCVSVTFGFETASNRLLKLMNKNTTVQQAHEAIRISHFAGLKIRGQLMVGFPGETDEDVELTGRFIKESYEVEKFGIHVFQPFPGSDVWLHPEKYGAQINRGTDFMDYHTIGKPDEELTTDKKVMERFKYLRACAGKRNIDSDM
jgi:radical SAM superfamily enzyme YgiQ (UPF0313 family)